MPIHGDELVMLYAHSYLRSASLRRQEHGRGDSSRPLKATLEWMNWFNDRQLLAPIGNIPPAEAEKHDSAIPHLLADWRQDRRCCLFVFIPPVAVAAP
jgi:hypothetical protein